MKIKTCAKFFRFPAAYVAGRLVIISGNPKWSAKRVNGGQEPLMVEIRMARAMFQRLLDASEADNAKRAKHGKQSLLAQLLS